MCLAVPRAGSCTTGWWIACSSCLRSGMPSTGESNITSRPSVYGISVIDSNAWMTYIWLLFSVGGQAQSGIDIHFHVLRLHILGSWCFRQWDRHWNRLLSPNTDTLSVKSPSLLNNGHQEGHALPLANSSELQATLALNRQSRLYTYRPFWAAVVIPDQYMLWMQIWGNGIFLSN